MKKFTLNDNNIFKQEVELSPVCNLVATIIQTVKDSGNVTTLTLTDDDLKRILKEMYKK